MGDTAAEKLTPSQLLIEVMERFQESEPTELLVVWTCEDGSVRSCNSTSSYVAKLGLATAVKEMTLADLRGSEE